MAVHIDHFSISARNIFESANTLREQTGLGFFNGGYFPGGNANMQFPLGGKTYLEIGGFVDPYVTHDEKRPKPWWWDAVKTEDRFTGLCLRVDTLDELKEIAVRTKTPIPTGPLSKTKPDGTTLHAYGVPSAGVTWNKGLPNWYFHPLMNVHPSGQPVIGSINQVIPKGISFIEMGGTEKAMSDWLGQKASTLADFKFNGKAPGLYAIGVKTDKADIVIRRKAAQEA